MADIDNQSLGEEFEFGQILKWRMDDTESSTLPRHPSTTFLRHLLNHKVDYVFKELKCAAKVILAFGFVLKNFEDGMCRYFYAHENNTITERSKFVCTQADVSNLKVRMQKMDRVDNFTRE